MYVKPKFDICLKTILSRKLVRLIRIVMVHILYIFCLEITQGKARLMIVIIRLRIKFKVKKLTVKLKLKLKIPKVRSLATSNLKVKQKLRL